MTTHTPRKLSDGSEVCSIDDCLCEGKGSCSCTNVCWSKVGLGCNCDCHFRAVNAHEELLQLLTECLDSALPDCLCSGGKVGCLSCRIEQAIAKAEGRE